MTGVFKFSFYKVIYCSKRFLHKCKLSMDKAYFRTLEEGEQFQLSFLYENKELKINRQFNFCRQLSEPVSTLLFRVSTNVEKIVKKKNKKKFVENKEAVQNVIVSLHRNNDQVEDDALCQDIFQPNNNIVLNILGTSYHVVLNSPWIDALLLPSTILATCPIYPSKFEAVFTDMTTSTFKWFRSVDKEKWSEVGDSFLYTPSVKDINCYLKFECLPRNDVLEGPQVETISENVVQAGPGICPFETRQQFTKERTQNKVFRVVTYNILAGLYSDMDFTKEFLHPYCPPYALEIDYRKRLILKEILGYNSDIICLQEVDRKVYNYDLKPILDIKGFESNFAEKGGCVGEGLATFYRKDRFTKLESNSFVFSEHISTDVLFADIWEKIATNSNLVTRILERTTTLQINVLEFIDRDNEILVVANTHFYFHPDSDHIRLLHGGLAIRYLENAVSKLKLKYSKKRISLIFCGDFNSTPECGVYKLFTTGEVPKDYIDYKSNAEEWIRNLELKQSFCLDSACGTPQYTNFTAGFADCLDYIFYEKTNLEVTQVVPLPSKEELTEHTALPSVVFPSDHIALISDLKLL